VLTVITFSQRIPEFLTNVQTGTIGPKSNKMPHVVEARGEIGKWKSTGSYDPSEKRENALA
jgi:hypothetical protein